MVVIRHLGLIQRHGRGAADLPEIVWAQSGTLSRTDGDVAVQIGQAKVGGAVAPVIGAEKREQGGGLRYGHELTRSECPALRREIEWNDQQLAKKYIHASLSSSFTDG